MVLRSRRHQILLLLLILFLSTLEHGHGSRTTTVFKFKPKSQHSTGHFLGFLPKRMPIPYSSPSKKHNDIGLQNQYSVRVFFKQINFCAMQSVINLKLIHRSDNPFYTIVVGTRLTLHTYYVEFTFMQAKQESDATEFGVW
ncbi:unnamed protein product [Sphenostylis stenocarpa]|uniref:Uncharacterized protein n=1 Tax=Sphenostylis stenocarpa TaxID=92480 RepID=A0AA86SXF9_9FABA|nr:unnamed protein product [Sphenostylis stenocarpa]